MRIRRKERTCIRGCPNVRHRAPSFKHTITISPHAGASRTELNDDRAIFSKCMTERQFDQFGPLQGYERIEPNIVLLYFVDVVVVVNLVEEEFIVLRAGEPIVPARERVDE